METLYGEIDDRQLALYKKKMHGDVFWLLLYKDPSLGDKFAHVDFDRAFACIQKRMIGLSRLLPFSAETVDILVNLEAAKATAEIEPFDFSLYRKLLFEAHNAIDRINLSSPPESTEEEKDGRS